MTRGFWIAAIVSFLLDQFSKVAVVHWLGLKNVGLIEVAPPFLVFHMAWNKGINFGLFQAGDHGRWILIVISIVIVVWVMWWLRKDQARPLAMVSGGLLVGGALGNVIDRVIYGAVADFLNMSCCGIANPFSFNIADATIFIGAIGLILFTGDKKQA